MKNKEKERQRLSTCLGLLFFALTTLAPTIFEKHFKYLYKNWLAEERAAFFTAYEANKSFEHGEYGASAIQILWANYCRLVDLSSCEAHLKEAFEESQKIWEAEFKNSQFIEEKYQVGVDEVTVIKTTDVAAWNEWGVLQDGTLLTITKLGNGREVEILSDEAVSAALHAGRTPAFLFRVEEDDSADTEQIPVIKTAQYTGSNFERATQESGTAVLGVNSEGTLVLTRGGEVSATEFTIGSKLYWPLLMDKASFYDADWYGNMASYISINSNMYCHKEPSYDCHWISSVARTREGIVVEVRLPIGLLNYDEAWQKVVQLLQEKGLTDWTFSDPMFEDSMIAAVDSVIKRDVLAVTVYGNGTTVEHDNPEQDPVDAVRVHGVVDGTYLVIWQDGEERPEPILLETHESSFLNEVDTSLIEY
jgi:hypothetical protein